MDSLRLYSLYCFAILFLYNYFLYPIAIITLSKIVKRKCISHNQDDTELPNVSFIIAAFNEEAVIEKKILNTLSLDYPKNKLEIIVVSDGSSDQTESIVLNYNSKGVISLHDDARLGKSSALNRGVSIARGEIVIFSDANNDFNVESIKEMVKHFTNPKIGAVTGAKHIYDNKERQSSKGDSLYWKYESAIKLAESKLGSITNADGEIIAVRKSLYKPIDIRRINDDAAITFDIIKSKHRIIYENNAKAFEEASKDLIEDFNVKVRMTAGGFQTLLYEWKTIFLSASWFSFTFISHKILRWLAPHFLIALFILSLSLINHIEIVVFLILQIIFYCLSIYGWFNRKKELPSVIYIPLYFTVMNCALFWGFIRFISNRTTHIWKKAER